MLKRYDNEIIGVIKRVFYYYLLVRLYIELVSFEFVKGKELES